MSIGQKNKVIPGCGTHHISIQTCDWGESLRLYRDVLGMELVAQFGPSEKPMALLDMGDGSHIELVAPNPEVGTMTTQPLVIQSSTSPWQPQTHVHQWKLSARRDMRLLQNQNELI